MGSQSANINDLASEHVFKASCNVANCNLIIRDFE